jgi:predicted ATPase
LQLIRRLSIAGFRSIRSQSLDQCGSFTSLIGKNSSGKSNLLRALNLFFTHEPDTGVALQFQRDYHDRRDSKKKRLSVAVEFTLPANFKFRRELSHLRSFGTTFTITRVWELDQQRVPHDRFEVHTEGRPLVNADTAARQFLNLIAYRYVPNRTVPSSILRNESQALADSLLQRIKGKGSVDELLKDLYEAASRFLKTADQSIQASGAPLREAALATAESLGAMLRMTGFQATGEHGGIVQDENWGAGHQAFFLYLVLYALDTNYGRFFGWRQATVWGIEEPESGLHRDLETRLAGKFRDWSRDSSAKLQIFQTTHSPVFNMAADVGYWTDLHDGATMFTGMTIPELTRAAEQREVVGWIHPILSYPWNPIVLVEGDVDAQVLQHTADVGGYDHLRILSLPALERSRGRGGKDAVVSFLKRSGSLIQNRPREAPFIVLFDWDVADEDIRQARRYYGSGADVHVLRMSERHCSALLGPTFKGIERFYPAKLIVEAADAGELAIGERRDGVLTVAAAELNQAKQRLAGRLRVVTERDELTGLMNVLRDVDAAANAYRRTQYAFPF